MAKRHTKPTPESPSPEEEGEVGLPSEEAAKPEISNLENYLEDNRGKIAIIAILAVVAIAVTSWVVYSQHAKEKEAAIEFTRASTIADYNLVIERHGGTVAGGNAAIMKAKLQWDSGEQTASLKTLNQFLGNFPDHPLSANGIYAIAVREAAMGNADVATQRLKEVIDKHPDSAVAPLAQLYLADLALGDGDAEEAKSLYDAAAKMDPAVVGVVERRLQAIESKTPIVAIDAPPLPKEEENPATSPTDPVTPPVPPTDPVKPPVPPTPPTDPVTPPVPPTPPTDPVTPPVPPTPPTDPVPPTPPADPVTPPVPPTDPVTPPVPPALPTNPVPPTPPADPVTPPVPPALPTDPVPPTPPADPVTPPVSPTPPTAPAAPPAPETPSADPATPSGEPGA